jgi:hypothetical protein
VNDAQIAFASRLSLMKEEARRLGLYVTMQRLDKVVHMVGFEIELNSLKGKENKPKISDLKPLKENNVKDARIKRHKKHRRRRRKAKARRQGSKILSSGALGTVFYRPGRNKKDRKIYSI